MPWVKERREEYREFIRSIGADCHIYYLNVSKEELTQRLNVRNKSGKDFYIVTPDMLDDFIEEFDEPIDEDVELVIQS